MAEYIEREALLRDIEDNPSPIYKAFRIVVKNQSTADVAEVRRGKWIDCIETGTSVAGVDITGLVGYQCSLCGRYEGKKEPYCNCGAKMDLGR